MKPLRRPSTAPSRPPTTMSFWSESAFSTTYSIGSAGVGA